MMIKANELRIGNWVYNDLNQRIIVTDIAYDGINGFHDEAIGGINYEYGGRIEAIQPIPLTEEWLVKFGAKKTGIDKRTFCETFILKGVKLILSNSGNFYYGKLYIGTVHKIQNLVFALTNEELILQS